jgi:outer membrane receptor protein involved in Fe transport
MASAAAIGVLAPLGAHAQGAPAAAPGGDAAVQEIVVTGSRIARLQTQTSVPVSIVSAQSIQDAGQTNLLDALRDLPIAGQSLDRNASNFLNFDNGVATVNLRNLGASRTLVLLNGRRSVGVPGSSAVDLNNIPVDLIDHVEIATGGASAVYGSDAVAGVVNIFLKNNFNGLQFHAEDMVSTYGDGNTPLFSVLGGHDFLDGKAHVTANFTYTKSDGVPSSARAYSENDSPSGSAYTPQGAFIIPKASDINGVSQTFTFDPNNVVIPYTGAASQRYNRASQRMLTTPVERYSGSLLAHYDFNPSAQAYAEFMYNKTYASGHIEPLAVDDGGNQGQSVYTFEGSSNFPGISTNNPYMPAAISSAALPNSLLDFRKRSNGIFDRSPQVERDYYRGVFGVKGDFLTDWKYDLSYETSQVRDNTHNEAILMTNYGASLQAVTLNGQVVCADPIARAAGCVPVNPFGVQPYSASALKWLSTYSGAGAVVPGATAGQQVVADFLRNNYQNVVSFAVNGPAFKLPGGPLSVAAGAEYHSERVSAVFDPFTRSGFSSQQLNGNEYGSFDSREGFAEVNAPILGGLTGIHELSLEAAARYADYSTIGGVWTYKYGGTYAPTPDFRVRAIYARAVRAPNLNELYSPQANTAQQVVDPCDQNNGKGESVSTPQRALPGSCLSIPGIANYLKSNPYYAYTLAQVQTIFGYIGGNPDLKAEATDTITAGFTFTPQFFRDFILTADYYSIKVNNAVSSIDPQTSVDQCFQTGSPNFCALVHRNANGFITEVDEVNVNAASYLVSGIDLQALYTLRPHFWGKDDKLTLDLYYNHKLAQQQRAFAGDAISDELGTADTYASQQLGSGFPDQFTFNANYAVGPLSLHYRMKYYGPVTASSGAYNIPAFTYHDMQIKYVWKSKYEFYFGVNNMLDQQPPFIASGNSQWPGTNTVADSYDLLGRTFFVGTKLNF